MTSTRTSRCHAPPEDEFAPSYASVVFAGDNLQSLVTQAETQGLRPCFTAWCSSCRRVYFLASDLRLFASPSAHHAHKLALLKQLGSRGI